MSVILDALRRARQGVPPPEPPNQEPPEQPQNSRLLVLLCLAGLVVVLASVGAAILFPAWKELMFWIATAGVLIPLGVALGFVARAVYEKMQQKREDSRRLREIRRLNEEYLREERRRAEEYAARNAQPESHRPPDWTDEPLRHEPPQDQDQEQEQPATFEWKMPLFILGCAVLGSFLAWHTISLLKSIEWGGVLRVALWLIAIAAIGWMVYKAASTKNWKWAAGAAAVLIAAVAVHSSWPEADKTPEAARADTPTTTAPATGAMGIPGIDSVELVQKTLTPENPLVVVVKPGFRVDAWPADPSVVKERWSRDGTAIVLTLTTEREVVVDYRLYRCTAVMPCDSKAPETTPEPVSPVPSEVVPVSPTPPPTTAIRV